MSSNFQQPPPTSRPSSAASTAISPSTSPSNSRFSFPTRPASSLALHQQHHYSPQKPARTQPNPHPYAIKTTSTALLSRSSSTSSHSSLNGVPGEGHGNALYQEKHRYIPPSPSGSDREGSDSPMKETRHRYSRSLTDGPVPLPPPPRGHAHSKSQDFSTSTFEEGQGHATHRRQSADDFTFDDNIETFNTRSATYTSAISYTNSDPNPDPKTWTSQQLAAYLTTEDTNMEDVVGYVRESGITGKAFMRLTEGDLTSLSENAKLSVLSASRSLRQRALRGRILGSSSTEQLPGTTSAPLSRQDTGSSLSGDDDFNPSLALATNGSITLTRKNGIRPKKRLKLKPRDRTLSDASDSSVSSNTSEISAASRNSRVKGLISSLEEKINANGSGVEEEGSASESSAEKERAASPVKTKKALPPRGGVVDLFSPPSQEEKDTPIQGLAKKNINGREPRLLPFPPNVPPQAQHGHHHLPTSPSFPTSPTFQHQHPYPVQQQYLSPMHTGAGHTLPLSPNTTGASADYELGFRSSPGMRNVSPSEVATYVVRHGNSPSNSPALGGSPGNGSGNGQSRLLPYPPVVGHAVMHHPRPRKVGGPGYAGDGLVDSGVEAGDEAGRNGPNDGGETSTSQSGTDVWETALESQTSEDSGNGTDDTKTTLQPDQDVQPKHEDKDVSDEPSMEELLKSQPQSQAFSTPPHKSISGVDAWEMELGDTVKRIGAGNSNRVSVRVKPRNMDSQRRKSSLGLGHTNGKAAGGAIMSLFEDAKGEEDHHKQQDASQDRQEKLREKELALEKRETGLVTREHSVEEREKALEDAKAVVQLKEREVEECRRAVEAQATALQERDFSLGEQERSIVEREYGIEGRQRSLEDKERYLREKESGIQAWEAKVEEKEKKVNERERKVDKRESASSRWEEKLGEREEELEERDNQISEKEKHVKQMEERVKAMEAQVQEKEKDVQEKETALREEKAQLESLRAGAVSVSAQTDSTKVADEGVQFSPKATDEATQTKPTSLDESTQASPEDSNPTRPKPYLTTPWAIKRDMFLGRFVGAFNSLSAAGDGGGFGGGFGGLQKLREGGGYLVLMSIGVCAFMLREVFNKTGGRGVGVWGGRR
ncbi:hypothetical protein CPC08DRAFT_822484 [Agrocybe pediades]|nr:hypothetical protein CPC08DRAFT_822484 [Agrocybe pediades]